MAQYFSVNPINPQPRLLQRAATIIRNGGVIAYPTDSSYALGCAIGDKTAMNRIRQIRNVDNEHNFTLICHDLSALSVYAKIDNETYRLLKRYTPGSYTFILRATREVPRRLQHPRRKSIGLRVPNFPIVNKLLASLGEPIMSSTLILPGETTPMHEAFEIRQRLEHTLALVIDGGPCSLEPTSVIDLIDTPCVRRIGKGDVSAFATCE